MNLFSTFDPSSLAGLPLNWAALVILPAAIPSTFWALPAPTGATLRLVTNYVKGELAASTGPSFVPGALTLFIALFIAIAMMNFAGLLPYVFTPSSHLSVTLAFALPLWLGHMVMAWLKTPSASLAHLVPVGTPPALMPLMVIIELTSSVIRPMTLSVRLAANMIAGHLLLSLISGPAQQASYPVISLILVATVALSVLESAVALIQAYVFTILSALYVKEVDAPSLSY